MKSEALKHFSRISGAVLASAVAVARQAAGRLMPAVVVIDQAVTVT